MPLQYGLSKVMCDSAGGRDSLRAGTSAILKSLENLQTNLMYNLQALLDYQTLTQYILWALGTVLTSAPTAAERTRTSKVQISTSSRRRRRSLDYPGASSNGTKRQDRTCISAFFPDRERMKAARALSIKFPTAAQRMGAGEPPTTDKIRGCFAIREPTKPKL